MLISFFLRKMYGKIVSQADRFVEHGKAGQGLPHPASGHQKTSKKFFDEICTPSLSGQQTALTAVPPRKEAISMEIARKSPRMSPIFDFQSADSKLVCLNAGLIDNLKQYRVSPILLL